MDVVSPSDGPQRAPLPYVRGFFDFLTDYRIHNRLTATALALQSGYPKRTVLRWLSGEGNPSLKRINSVCRRLGYNPARILSSKRLRDKLTEREFSLEDICRRYSHWFTRDPYIAMEMVWHAAVRVKSHLISCGETVNLISPGTADNDVIWTAGTLMNGYRITVSGQGEQGIRIRLFVGSESIGEWRSLTEKNLHQILQCQRQEPPPKNP